MLDDICGQIEDSIKRFVDPLDKTAAARGSYERLRARRFFSLGCFVVCALAVVSL